MSALLFDMQLNMKHIIPVTDLQRQAAKILNGLDDNEPVVITQRGRASAVLISAERYAEIEEDLKTLDDLELIRLLEDAKQDVADGKTIAHDDVKNDLASNEMIQVHWTSSAFLTVNRCRRESR
ncbi:MAG: type II toxin-antitoxin system Phd/YefM family antitoxin [Acidobacteria bacterium]|nr:type II toxin-antitoxin system Phd/YefM family antitoxin [Acidobacteriota bacterium]